MTQKKASTVGWVPTCSWPTWVMSQASLLLTIQYVLIIAVPGVSLVQIHPRSLVSAISRVLGQQEFAVSSLPRCHVLPFSSLKVAFVSRDKQLSGCPKGGVRRVCCTGMGFPWFSGPDRLEGSDWLSQNHDLGWIVVLLMTDLKNDWSFPFKSSIKSTLATRPRVWYLHWHYHVLSFFITPNTPSWLLPWSFVERVCKANPKPASNLSPLWFSFHPELFIFCWFDSFFS